MTVPLLVKDRIGLAQWGFTVQSKPVFNARSETVADKPSFRESWTQSRRCLIPADGFYEWQHDDEKGRKQPYFIKPSSGDLCLFGGLWQRVKRNGVNVIEFTVLTKDAEGDMAHIHPRTPVMFDASQAADWFAADPEFAMGMVQRAHTDTVIHKVDCRVGNIRNNDAALPEPVS